MKAILLAATTLMLATPTLADGDIEAGAKTFGKCKACHSIANGDEVIAKGGKIGPNLYGVIGRAVASEDFRYGEGIKEAGAKGLVWDQAMVAAYVADPTAWLIDATGDAKAKSKMAFKLKTGGEDVAAYLASVGPQPAN